MAKDEDLVDKVRHIFGRSKGKGSSKSQKLQVNTAPEATDGAKTQTAASAPIAGGNSKPSAATQPPKPRAEASTSAASTSKPAATKAGTPHPAAAATKPAATTAASGNDKKDAVQSRLPAAASAVLPKISSPKVKESQFQGIDGLKVSQAERGPSSGAAPAPPKPAASAVAGATQHQGTQPAIPGAAHASAAASLPAPPRHEKPAPYNGPQWRLDSYDVNELIGKVRASMK